MRARSKRIIKNVGISFAVFTISFCAVYIALYLLAASTTSKITAVETRVTPTQDSVVTSSFTPPSDLRIDRIGVGTIVKPVGLTAEGDMDIDDNNQEVAWYSLGPKPGEKGSAVIAGHYGWKNGEASVFNKLNELKPGDEVVVTAEDAKRTVFTVTRTALYEPEQDATEVFSSSDGKARLNLITCQGSWDVGANTYNQRLVVFTEAKT